MAGDYIAVIGLMRHDFASGMTPSRSRPSACTTLIETGDRMGVLGTYPSTEFDYSDDEVHPECLDCLAATFGALCAPELCGPTVQLSGSKSLDLPVPHRTSA